MVNYSAEQGVKLSSDFLAAAHSKSIRPTRMFYKLLSRADKKIPNLRRKYILGGELTALFIQNGCFTLHTSICKMKHFDTYGSYSFLKNIYGL